ncbi:HAD-IIB family hydrolase [Spiroplasma endosymbiont of Labia minor]|uniref:HAD-IIB family hydrolase n=1 Tax=Spiroplasma endosymbiont of Labia minor TaxID=3066305 RepID=UPI0030CF1D29
MKQITTIITDLDGTILENGDWANLNDKKILLDAQQKGYNVTIATGQGWITAKKVAEEIQIDKNLNWMICNNGGYITTVNPYNPQAIQFIDSYSVTEAFSLSLKLNLCLFMFTQSIESVLWNGIECPSKTIKAKEWWTLHNFQEINVDQINDNKIIQLMFFVNYELESEFNNSLNFLNNAIKSPSYIEDVPVYEFNSKTATKGLGIENLAKILNINKNSILVFGDADNDIDMFKKISNSVAVDNAVESIKQIAKYKTDSNKNGGVGNFICKNLLGE